MSRDWDVPFHYLSIIAIVALDVVWGFLEGWTMMTSPLFVIVLSVVVGIAGGMAVYYVQRFMAHDSERAALAKGIVMGIVAGVPFMVTSTVLGLTIMIWLAAASVFKGGKAKRENEASETKEALTTAQIVSREVRKYAFDGKGTNVRLFPMLDDQFQNYSVLEVGYPSRHGDADVLVMARVIGEVVIIEADASAAPLVDALVKQGIPRARIVLGYAGEPTDGYSSAIPLPAYD
ncbi:MAG: element excision factor XisI family protein [Anaerolineae bacterium]